MEDFYYRVYTPSGRYSTPSRDEAFFHYEENDGFKIETVSKDLFPTINVIVDEKNFNTERIRKDLTVKETSEALRKAVDKYDKANTKQLKMKLNCNTDNDILEYLETIGNKQGYLKELIRKDMKQKENG